jgi:nucleotide-binding universal stress UspA family protein
MLPKVNRILYATDLSESAKPAFFWAMSLAEQYDAEISIIHVIPDMVEIMSGSMGYDLSIHFDAVELSTYNKEGQSRAMASVKERVKNVYDEMKDELPSCRVDLHHIVIRSGDSVQEIIAESVSNNYDMVVMGSHGHGVIEGFLLGSVARGVVNKCVVPVLTIKIPDAKLI